ncbi:MAG: GFA family protein [Candidatus Latescibacteria bacterium]|nr:GFA family protein [Candidatus Latescibacterota bacterium]
MEQTHLHLTGRCLCGAVTYDCGAEPASVTYCHCDTCRRMTGSAFNIGVGVPAAELHVTGQVRGYQTAGQPDESAIREFCPDCGSPLFTRYPTMVFIKAGSLDDPTVVSPTRQIWTEMAVPWSRIPDGLTSHPRNGPSPWKSGTARNDAGS